MMQLQNMLRMRMGWAEPSGPYHEVVLSSRIRLARNLARYPFPSRANAKALEAVLGEVFSAARQAGPFAKAAYLNMESIEPFERVFLAERRLVSQALAAEPNHRGVVIGEREILSCMVNEEDHLRLQAIDSGLCLGDLWARLQPLEDELSQHLDFAFRSDWGYLTACPTNTGTALRVSALLHLPALAMTGRINAVLEGLTRLGMVARGLYGEGTRVLGDFYQVSNATALGRSEPDFIAAIESGVKSLIQREMDIRRSLAEGGQKIRLEDLVYRALGILSHARAISYEETLQHLSYVRVAASLGWKVPTNLERMNEMIVFLQPAHLQMVAGGPVEASQRDVLRAEILRQRLK